MMTTQQTTMQNARLELLKTCQLLQQRGLNRGTSGNVSVRADHASGQPGFLITPSGMPSEAMQVEDLVWMDFAGNIEGRHAPSSEWRFHYAILQARKEINAVVHTHSTHATSFSTLRQDLPAFHYMIAVAGGATIRCAPYALFGSQALSNAALVALEGRLACLLANHGVIAIGAHLSKALSVAEEVEALCQQFMHAKQMGEPTLLTDEEMAAVIAQFTGYGQWGK